MLAASRFHSARLLAGLALAVSGRAATADRRVEPQYHSPLPQLHRVAVLPFFNQSAEPTVDGEAVARQHFSALEDVPGLEAMPMGEAVGSLSSGAWPAAAMASSRANEAGARDAVRAIAGSALAGSTSAGSVAAGDDYPLLPPDWPDPRGFVPPAPSPSRSMPRPQHEPIITHTRIFHGQDAQLTELLEDFYFFRDDARFGGWLGYLQRPDDHVGFCGHVHVTETLAARGGAGEGRVVYRWPIGRYDP